MMAVFLWQIQWLTLAKAVKIIVKKINDYKRIAKLLIRKKED